MPSDFAPAIGAAAFWTFVAIIVVAGIVSSAFRHRETQKTIRLAIEKGQTLDPETLDRLLRSDRPRTNPRDARRAVMVGGIMLLAIGAGLALIGWFLSQTSPGALYPGLGAGSLVGLLGVGLLATCLVFRGNGRE